MRIVVTGRTGQVVSALAEKSLGAGVELGALGRPDLDLAVAVEGIGAAEYRTLAKRPANSRFSSEKLREVYGLVLPDQRHSTEMVLNRLIGNPAGVSR